jgi:hypothetical protein
MSVLPSDVVDRSRVALLCCIMFLSFLAQSMTTAAAVLISRDAGATWKASGDIEDARTWLVNPVIEEGSKGQLIMMFRSATGGSCLLRAEGCCRW